MSRADRVTWLGLLRKHVYDRPEEFQAVYDVKTKQIVLRKPKYVPMTIDDVENFRRVLERMNDTVGCKAPILKCEQEEALKSA